MKTVQTDSLAENRERLHQLLEAGSQAALVELLESLTPAEIADVLESLPRESRPALWRKVSAAVKGEVLLEAHGEARQHLIDDSDRAELLDALATLEMDELADLDADLPVTVLDAMVRAMDAQRRRRYEAVRDYPDDTAGGLMDIDAAAVRADVSLKAVLRYMRKLRSKEGGLPEHLDSLMVVDRNNLYRGVLRLSDLVSRKPSTMVGHAMTEGVPAIPVMESAAKVARLFEDQDLISAAVVDDGGYLLGRITVDDVVDVMRKEAEQDIMNRAGLSGATDMFAPLLPSAGRRAIWLGVNLINAFIAAWVIGLFEASIDKLVALAVLMPVVASMGGVSGNQTLTLVTRAIALEQVGKSNAKRLLMRELALGVFNGVFWAVVVALVAVFWFGDPRLGVVFGVALVINLLMGAAAGTLVPLGLQRLGIDPALAGGVALVAVTDVVGFFSFLGLATLVLL